MDVSLVRAFFVIGMFIGGTSFGVYLVLWIIVPAAPYVSPNDEYFAADPTPRPKPAPFAAVNQPKTVTTGSIIGGLVLILLGVYLTLDQYDIIHLQFNTFWPIVLIVIGLILMFGFWQKGHASQQTNAEADEINNTDNAQTI